MTLSTTTVPTWMRRAGALALAVSLAACGGKASFPINVKVTGLLYNGLVLNSNGMDLPLVPAAGAVSTTSFTTSFPNTISYGEVFNVTQKTGTAAQHQTCTTIDPLTGRDTATDTAGRTAGINVVLTCAITLHTVSGTITTSGAAIDGLTLINGSTGGTLVLPAASTTFTFGATVPWNVSYGVTILTQPTNGVVCTVNSGTGVMGDTDVILSVTCN